MAVQATTQQQSIWAQLRRLAQTPDGRGAGMGADSLSLTPRDPAALFNLPAKGMLALGDSGPDVAAAQQVLRQLGYYKEPTNTGVFGLMTALAVKAFQADFALPILGEVGFNTRKTLAEALAGGKGGTRTSSYKVPTGSTWMAPSTSGWNPPAEAPPPPTPPIDSAQSVAPGPNSYFISQIYDPRFNPYAPRSTANCGPVSLAMALVAFGKAPGYSNQEDLIDQVRVAMTGRNDMNELTNENQIKSAASRYGLRSTNVSTVDDVAGALAAGKLVVLAGNPAAYNYGFTGDQYFPFSGGHFVLVTAIDGNRVVVNDPLSHVGAIVIGRKHLQDFMAYKGWNSGVAVSPIA